MEELEARLAAVIIAFCFCSKGRGRGRLSLRCAVLCFFAVTSNSASKKNVKFQARRKGRKTGYRLSKVLKWDLRDVTIR